MEASEGEEGTLRVELGIPSNTNNVTSEQPRNRISVIHIPVKKDFYVFNSKKDLPEDFDHKNSKSSQHKNEGSYSDSGIDRSEVEADSSSKHKEKFYSKNSVTDNIKTEVFDQKSCIQSINFNLDVKDKSTEHSLSSQRFHERNKLAKKITENLQNSNTPQNIKIKDRSKTSILWKKERPVTNTSRVVKSCRSNSYQKTVTEMESGENRQMDVKSREKLSSENSKSLQTFRSSNGHEWEELQKQLLFLQSQGYDAEVALWSLVTSYSNVEAPKKLDWRRLAKSMGKDPVSMDFFSIYPWSKRTKEQTFSRVGEYLQVCVQENQVSSGDEVNNTLPHRRTPSWGQKPPKGPHGVKFTKSPRGFTKKDKSKTPGEVALDQARHKNSKLFKETVKYEGNPVQYEMLKPTTSHSLPNISLLSSAVSRQSNESTITLPNIHTARSTKNGKIYSGIYRLATPPDKTRKQTIVENLQTPTGQKSSLLQVRTFGIPSNDSLSYVSESKVKSTSSEHVSNDYQLPLLYGEHYATHSNFSEPLVINQIVSRKNKAQKADILENIYGRSNDPPKPPPVTPNVKKARENDKLDEMNVYMIKYQKVKDAPGSIISSHKQENFILNDPESDSEFSSINSVSSVNGILR